MLHATVTSHSERSRTALWARREFLGLGLVALAGCTSPMIRGQSPEAQDLTGEETQGLLLVGDYCGGWGLNFKRMDAIGLVTNLDNTGSDPPPSQAREYLIGEMQGRDVKDPSKVLASPRVSLVQITAYFPPAVQKGDPIDVVVRIPKKSATTSLRGGWLMQARLREMQSTNTRILRGHEAGLAQGHVIVDSIFNGDGDRLNEVRGRILGGGISNETRTLGLVVRRDDVSIETTSVIGAAVNQRFHTFDRGSKKGVAEPKNDKYVKLLVPPRYKHNLVRYVAVVRSIPMHETPVERARRLDVLERKLFEPTTSAKASLHLEAIGKEAIPILQKGLTANDIETRFHAAEALAYLDEPQSAKVLAEAARNESAFRWSALAALSSMDHVHAYEALSDLLHVSSAETRYGAFRAMRLRNPNDPMVKGEMLGGQCSLHVLATMGEPMIHISKAERSEIVLFGQNMRMRAPSGIYAGKQILLTSTDPEQVKISRFVPGEEDKVVYANTTVEQVVRAIASVGGTYGDVIQALHEAKKAGLIEARVAVDTLPKPGRTFYRDAEEPRDNDDAIDLESLMVEASPSGDATGSDAEGAKNLDDDPEISETFVDPKFTPATKKGVWSRLTGWFSVAK
jgi:flagellar basal body P-ring protein FlgI